MNQVLKVCAALLVLLLSNNIYAQNKSDQKAERTPEEMSQKHADRMKSELNLNEEQTKKVYDLNLKYAKQGEKDRAQREKERELKKAEAIKKNDQRNAELKKILTNEQYDQMLKNQELKKDKMKQKGKGDRDKKFREPKLNPEK